MTELTVPCPQCQSPMIFESARRFVKCTSCGGCFAVRDGPPAQGSPVAAVALTRPNITQTEARQRLDDLSLEIAEAEEEAQLKQADVDATTTAYWRGRLGLQKVIAPSQNRTYLSGILAAGAAFLSLFFLDGAERLYGSVIAIIAVMITGGFHREWRGEETRGQSDLSGSFLSIDEARVGFETAADRLADLNCEQALYLERMQGQPQDIAQ